MDLLRQRFRLFCLVVGGLLIALSMLPASLAWRSASLNLTRAQVASLVANILAGVLIALIPRVRARAHARRSLADTIRRTTLVVVMSVFAQMTSAMLLSQWITFTLKRFGIDFVVGPLIPLVAFTALVHVSASLTVPWTLAESARPAMVLLASLAAIELISGDPPQAKAFGLLAIAAAVSPGLIISWLRYSGLRESLEMRVLSGRYREMQRELSYARRVHERLFPMPIELGRLRMSFTYEPMRQIGGDYLDAHVTPAGALSLVLIDVTGHGIAAALAVNRLHGEIKRVFAEDREAPPERVIRGLNQYVYLTLAGERVFATALALRVDPVSGSGQMSSAGHPPALLRRRDGRVEPLDSTAPLLGVLADGVFETETTNFTISPGDALVAYTDGAIECTDSHGAQLGIEGFARAIAESDGASVDRLLARLREAVRKYRAGEPEDDILLAAIRVAGSGE